jgi:hypothetical protein
MPTLLERRCWAASWLREQTRAVSGGLLPLHTLPSAITRALDFGLSHEEVAILLDEVSETLSSDRRA